MVLSKIRGSTSGHVELSDHADSTTEYGWWVEQEMEDIKVRQRWHRP